MFEALEGVTYMLRRLFYSDSLFKNLSVPVIDSIDFFRILYQAIYRVKADDTFYGDLGVR